MANAVSRSRILMVATALVVFLEGGTLEAFVIPSGLAATHRNFVPSIGDSDEKDQQQKLAWKPLRSFKFIKGQTSYGDITDGTVNSGMMGGPSAMIGGGNSMGGNSLTRGGRQGGRRGMIGQRSRSWWNSSSGFSRTTPITLLAAGSVESWPVMEADDLQILVAADSESNTSNNAGSSVKATLERWERDISLEVVGYDMLGNQMQPGSDNGTDRCTQSIKFDVADGDVYPFSGTISVPPPLTVEDSVGNKQTVMMVLNNPDENDDNGGFLNYDEYGNEIPAQKPSSIEAKLEPLYKSPDQKYAEAQQQQQLQYDEWGNEVYNPHDQTTTIPSNGYQSFQLDANDPATGKIKISLEREEVGGGGGRFGGFGGGGNGNASSEARVEIYHGFRDQYGNSYSSSNYNNYNSEADDEDRRISLEVSTMHPTFSSVVDTMPANLLAKHALSSVNDLSTAEPYLEVRIVNTGGAALKAGVTSFLPQYKPQNQQQRQKYEREQLFNRNPGLQAGTSVKADDPFLLVDSAQSTTSSRRMKRNMNTNPGREKTYVRANNGASRMGSSSSNNFYNGGGPSINTMWTTGDRTDQWSQGNLNNNYGNNNYGGAPFGPNGIKADPPSANLNDGVGRFVQAQSRNRRPAIRSRVNPEYWDAIDTTATAKDGRNTGLVANNDFTMANGSKTTAIVPGSMKKSGTGTGYRRVSPSSVSLQSFGGNSGNASGMQQPFQGQYQSQQYESQSFGGSAGGSGLQEAFPMQTSPQRTRSFQGSGGAYAGNGNVIGNGVIAGRPAASTSAFRDNRVPGNSEQLGVGRSRNGFQPQTRANSNNGFGGGQQSSSSFQSSFTPQPSNNFGGSNEGSNNFGGNSNGNSNFMGSMKNQAESSDSFSRGGFGSNNSNNQASGSGGFLKNAFGGNNQQSQINRNNSFGGNTNSNPGSFGGANNNNNNSFGGSNNSFGGNTNSNSGSFGGANNNSFGSSSNNNNSFGANANSNSGSFGGVNNNSFGSRSNNNNSFGANANSNSGSFGGVNNNSFGSSNNNNNNSFGGGNNNGGSPFGNLGAPPQTKGNSKNPFATLNGETTQMNSFDSNSNNNFNNNSNFKSSFGGGAGGNLQRPLSPSPQAMKNPFSGLNGNKQNSNGMMGGQRTTTAMRSTNTVNGIDDYNYGTSKKSNENSIMGFAKKFVKGISDYGTNNNDNYNDNYYR